MNSKSTIDIPDYHINFPINAVKEYAIAFHKDTNHLYDGYLPYEFHLRMVVRNAHKFKHLVPEAWFRIIICACWHHDDIEDTRINYSTIKKLFGHDVAEIVYAVSNEKGRDRTEQESDKYFEGIRNTFYATFVKLCDRIANIEYSKMTALDSDNKLQMYQKEHARFREELYDITYIEMFHYMDQLLK